MNGYLLVLLEQDGALVTVDAIGCQKKITERIVERWADDLLTVKEDQPALCETIGDALLDEDRARFAVRFTDYAEREKAGHGRRECRRCWARKDETLITALSKEWTGLWGIVVIESERTLAEKDKTFDRQWCISSREESADLFLAARCAHWQVENELHWKLDVAFREDKCRVRKGDGAENMSVPRRMAVNLSKGEKTEEGGVEARRCRAGWDEQYMETVLARLRA